MKRLNDINIMHYNKVINIAEYNLLHDIINDSKFIININSHNLFILHVCMNTRRGKANLRTSWYYWIVGVVPRF